MSIIISYSVATLYLSGKSLVPNTIYMIYYSSHLLYFSIYVTLYMEEHSSNSFIIMMLRYNVTPTPSLSWRKGWNSYLPAQCEYNINNI